MIRDNATDRSLRSTRRGWVCVPYLFSLSLSFFIVSEPCRAAGVPESRGWHNAPNFGFISSGVALLLLSDSPRRRPVQELGRLGVEVTVITADCLDV